MAAVERREGESFEALLKRFRSSVARAGVIAEYKRHQAFVSKSERARARLRRALRKQRKLLQRSAQT